MKSRLFFIVCSVLLISLLLTTVASAGEPVTQRVIVGGPDVCAAFGESPGCDKNFSLVAIKYADGRVSGQWTDRFGGGLGGFHAEIDCLIIEGNDAWVSGMVTQGVIHDPESGQDFNLAGVPVSTMVRDNGISAKDPADQISFSFFGFDAPFQVCTEQPAYPLFDAPQGQSVVVD
jgi:hypothetical protein